MQLTGREVATIRAALMAWKDELSEGMDWIREAHEFRKQTPLSSEEVDELRERLKTGTSAVSIGRDTPALRLQVPTYLGSQNAKKPEATTLPDFGLPEVPVVIHEDAGIRVILGTHDVNDRRKPDIQIERRPNGWAVFVHPDSGDPVATLYVLDNGKSFLMPEVLISDPIQIVDQIPAELDCQ